ncbi:hydantoinase B/oxoprolinase family protein [Brucella pseudogrignonensis]|uniref:hydantoinase B/oxoprolinase family protein n=1 Tax=Brucella pseudogrignonensis TaxID=419475 RepID=UPI0028BBE2A9|nr:hydantoinase B/oxoprolinase family protein [Brucella pseudogrignonensis]MDT6942435.1 hydantoinase B/oxoprolinase family protein [Brucella pseudogrignonensis]
MDATAYSTATKLSMFQVVVLRRRFESVVREMSNTLAKTGRSGVLNTALDFSCTVTDSRFQSLSAGQGLPVHTGAIHLIPQAVVDKFGEDMKPGDCFVNNSSYHGNTHCADFTLCSPVFYGGEIVFYSIARAHFSDMGFPTPDTYAPLAQDYYQEGLMLPCVRIQKEGVDVPEVIDICQANIRAPEIFYGDYLATLGAVRTGERRVLEICEEFGVSVVKQFLTEYQDYADAMASEAIAQLPAGCVSKEFFHDSVLPEYPVGIPVRAKLSVDPENRQIEIDLRDNIDNLPLGINMNEATVLACCATAIMNILGPEVPRCAGALRRVTILMRDGSAIGKPKFPAATCASTTNLAHILIEHLQSMFADLRPGLGTAYGTIGHPASAPVVSGSDSRFEHRTFVNQIMLGYWGGPASSGYDGWLTYGSGTTQGMLWQSSVEVVEYQQPVIVEKLEIRTDSFGPGKWIGGGGASCVLRARADTLRFTCNSGARAFPPPGTAGGKAGAPNLAWKQTSDGQLVELPIFFDVEIKPGERLVSEGCGGGGYGRPTERDPAKVLRSVEDGLITVESARETYLVEITATSTGFAIDIDATRALRSAKTYQAN